MNALPYFIYGPGTHLLYDDSLLSQLSRNTTRYELCAANHTDIDCDTGKHSTVWAAVVLLWFCCLVRGLGFTAYFVIGFPYIDDNVSKNNSALYLSLVSALRLVGPAGVNPGISKRDPRFIGAWWIGFLVIGGLLFLVSLPMFLFPKQLKTATVKAVDNANDIKGFSGIVNVIRRLATNRFRQTSSGASFLTGTTSVLPMAIGIILGGVMIKFIKPRPLTLIIFMFAVEWFYNG
ncbi:unnamed protein product, partial [Oppiella nova]